ncbi:MAG TPA: hypothetical protein VM166_01585 [Gemmatimonadaceae bacterium]|nr:hypothetical protein [Gemmatimonadaceae bacterium]
MTVKIEAMNGETPELFEYGNVFAREEVGGRARLRVGLDEAQDAAVATLVRTLRGPFQLLYVLHTTRTAAEIGRYESPELTSADVQLFLSEFGRFLREDSRHDLWVRSHDDDAIIVLDRHNLIYAYGPRELFERELKSSGAHEGEPAVLGAHVHHYHPAWDDMERRMLERFDWQISPLGPSDVQFDPERDRSR